MPLTENPAEDVYRSNIQIADLNALNAVLAIGTWKRLCGFYVDNVQADHFTYSTNLNEMSQESINAGRKRDAEAKARRHSGRPGEDVVCQPGPQIQEPTEVPSFISRLKKWLRF
ncbi:Dinucleotide-utilizing enzyme [Pseudomonas chlororaphis subsp. aurantiaca]|nr:Dinucleotide-utilizing enzyme [Pseudomonas chlororaphis subsp. aurantiaca]